MGRIVKFTTNQTIEQFCYIAGIIDGEGCFYLGCVKQGKYGNGTQWHCLLKICSCDAILIDWLNEIFGGYKEMRTRYTSKRSFERPVYSWTATGLLLDHILEKCSQYLLIKKPHSEIMKEIRKTFQNIGSKRLPEEIVKKRTHLMKQLKFLNSRFHSYKNP